MKCEKGVCRYGAKCIKNKVCKISRLEDRLGIFTCIFEMHLWPTFKLIFQTLMFSASVVVLIVTRMVTTLFVQEGLARIFQIITSQFFKTVRFCSKSSHETLKPTKANRQAFPNMCYYQQEQCRRYYSPSWYDFDRYRIKCSGRSCRMNGKCRNGDTSGKSPL